MEPTETVDIDSLPAGRELDILVAEKVMGCTIGTGKGGQPVCLTAVEGQPANRISNYSTDIADAWEVVEKLKNVMLSGVSEESKMTWTASFDGLESENIGIAETASLAICRAGLKVVMK